MLIEDLPFVMLKCLLCTIIIELIVGIIIGIREKKDIINIVLVNIMTNPLVTSIPIYFYLKYGINARIAILVLLEVFAVLIEGVVYYKFFRFRKTNGFIVSLILNMSSYFIGEIINRI